MQGLDRPPGGLAPLALAVELPGVARSRFGRRRGAALEGATIGDLAGLEDIGRRAHRRAAGEADTTRTAGGGTFRRATRRGAVAARPAAARAPATAAAGPEAWSGGSLALEPRRLRSCPGRPPARFDAPPRAARPDERAAEAIAAGHAVGRGPGPRLRAMDAAFVAPAQLRRHGVPAQHRVDRLGHVGVDGHAVAGLDLDDHVEGGRRLALEHALLGPPAARLLVAQRHRLDAADEVGERRVQHEVVEVVAVGRADELHAALGDGAGGGRLQLRADLVDDDDLGHVVLHRLDHHVVLQRRARAPACGARGRCRGAGCRRRRRSRWTCRR